MEGRRDGKGGRKERERKKERLGDNEVRRTENRKGKKGVKEVKESSIETEKVERMEERCDCRREGEEERKEGLRRGCKRVKKQGGGRVRR